ncbi:MAG: ATP-binding protein, partial [Verrucomicrobiota bacterium]
MFTLYEKFTGSGAAQLLMGLPNGTEKTYENDWLEFKGGKTEGEDLKKAWSKAICSFANSEGGILIWGLRCAKGKTSNIDAVSELDLVKDINALKSRLMELRHASNDPPVAGIQIQAIPTSPGASEGFVVCLIPESLSKPHRAEFSGKRFYIRMGDSSNECNVSLLRQLFYPKRTLRMRVQVTLKPIPIGVDFKTV